VRTETCNTVLRDLQVLDTLDDGVLLSVMWNNTAVCIRIKFCKFVAVSRVVNYLWVVAAYRTIVYYMIRPPTMHAR